MRKAAESTARSDAEIELGRRRRATSSAKDAEVLLRWLSRPRTETSGLGFDDIFGGGAGGLVCRAFALRSPR
jgi:hypothetical protein